MRKKKFESYYSVLKANSKISKSENRDEMVKEYYEYETIYSDSGHLIYKLKKNTPSWTAKYSMESS